jgi:hypothetical protein
VDAGASGEAADALPPAVAQEEVRERFERFVMLRMASRALAPSLLGSEADQGSASEALRGRLSDLARRARTRAGSGGPPAQPPRRGELAAVDEELEALAASLRGRASSLPLPQLRSTLPHLLTEHREEVVALLDLLVEDEQGASGRIPLLEYLFTLLSTELEGRRRRVTSDPVFLTPRTSAFCERMEDRLEADAAEAEAAFFGAANQDRASDLIDGVVGEMRSLKDDLETGIFASGVLRAVVTYNASVWNRVGERIEVARDADRAAAVFEQLFGTRQREHAGPEAVAAPEQAALSVFDAGGMRDIAEALQRRIGEEPAERGREGRSPAERIACCLDLSELTGDERALLAREASSRLEEVVGSAILTSLLIGALPVVKGDLDELGIATAGVQGAWVQELDRAFKELVNQRIAEASYQEACALSETKTKFLHLPLSVLQRRERRQRAASPPASEPTPAHAAPIVSGRDAWRTSAADAAARRRRRPTSPPRALRTLVLACASTALFTFAAVNFLRSAPSSTRMLAPGELHRVSTFLESGYRNDYGMGRLFVGTLSDGWLDLDAERRRRLAEEAVARLRHAGVEEVMLFDRLRRLQVQASDGRLRIPRSDS